MVIGAVGSISYTSQSNPDHEKIPYQLIGVDVNFLNHIWVTNITYVNLRLGFLYLFAIIDLYSRFILAWDIVNTMTAIWCKHVFDQSM
jgi:putative transposase